MYIDVLLENSSPCLFCVACVLETQIFAVGELVGDWAEALFPLSFNFGFPLASI